VKIALATCRNLATDADDAALLAALGAEGHDAQLVSWDAPFDWGHLDACVLRSTWDYHERVDEFLRWVDSVARVTLLVNDAETVRWNAHKSYLRELGARGVPVALTVFLEHGKRTSLRETLAEHGWRDAIIKPAVSAGAHETMRVGADEAPAQAHLDKLLERGDVLVQPYFLSIEGGERSHIFIFGARTHSVIRPGGLGVPVHLQNVARPFDPPPAEAELAASILRALPTARPLYARIDLLHDEAGELRLMELELIEPSLFLRHGPDGARPFAKALERWIGECRRPKSE
jgi:glutathione synthase/RimK-type ligase-like ATP-grasp enzyme